MIEDALRKCSCETAHVEPVPEIPQILRCVACHGWVRLVVSGVEDVDQVTAFRFPPGPDDDE